MINTFLQIKFVKIVERKTIIKGKPLLINQITYYIDYKYIKF